MPEHTQRPGSIDENKVISVTIARDVISCTVCGLVQFRTRTGNCRRCVRPLPPVEPGRIARSGGNRKPRRARKRSNGKWVNLEMVENIGQRIQQFRKLSRVNAERTFRSLARFAILPGASGERPDDTQSWEPLRKFPKRSTSP